MKVLFVTTISNTVNSFLIPHIKLLVDQGHQVDVAFKLAYAVKPEITDMGCRVFPLDFQRSPLAIGNYFAYKNLKKLMLKEKYDLVHTHTPVASAVVRLVCRNMKSVTVFYTTHGFHFFKGAPLQNWLLYYPVEKWLSRYTDALITINREDYERAKKFFKPGRIEYVPGVGFDGDQFREAGTDIPAKRIELGLPEGAFAVLSVGELNHNKNHETVIRALARLNDGGIHYLICGQGPLENHLRNLIRELGLESQVHLLGFRKDIPAICKASDVFVQPSFREGLPVALMEAMAAGLPAVCSDIRGNSDLIENGKGGYLIKPGDVDGFAAALDEIHHDNGLREVFIQNSRNRISSYSMDQVMDRMDHIYGTAMSE